jgi:hypothetical protein
MGGPEPPPLPGLPRFHGRGGPPRRSRRIPGPHRQAQPTDGERPSDRAAQSGTARSAAENIGWAYNADGLTRQHLVRGLVEGWKHSPGQRRNLPGPGAGEEDTGRACRHKGGRTRGVSGPSLSAWPLPKSLLYSRLADEQ